MIVNKESILFLFFISVFTLCLGDNPTNGSVVSQVQDDYKESAVLSRRKRFIIFTEGSSLQLVFCLTFPALTIGDVILWGYTAALAYELPQDPYSPFHHHADPLHRRMDTKVVYYTDEDGKVLYKKPYKKKLIVNPAFAKRSVDDGRTDAIKIDRKQMHAASKRVFLDANVEFHRSSRAALYGKIETMLYGFLLLCYRYIALKYWPHKKESRQVYGNSIHFTAFFLNPGRIVTPFYFRMGGNGRHCTLKTLCLVGQTRSAPQGGLLQEILRAVFTLPKGEYKDPYEAEYDLAHWSTKSCDELYPECDTPLSEPSLNNIQ